MKCIFILLVFLISSCNIQTRYELKKQSELQPNFQNTPEPTQPPTDINKPITQTTNNTVIANIQSEIIRLNTVSEELVEKMDSLETLLLNIKTSFDKKTKQKKNIINKEAKKLITKKKKIIKQPLGNFSRAQKFFQASKWEMAIQGYEQYRKLNPRGKSYILATYNIALALEKLGFKEEARSFYEEILDPHGRYFRSKIAKKIRAKQKKMSSKKAKKI